MAKIDRPILLEIVRIVQAQSRVPEHISIQKRRFSITYLEDHRQRIEEALRRLDNDRLNMLFGQLESKIKYQVVRTPRGETAHVPVKAERTSKPRTIGAPKPPKVKASRPAKRATVPKQASGAARSRAAHPVSHSKAMARKTAKVARPAGKKSKPSRGR